ncbi:MAG: hypothetical protein K5917_00430 [Clostridiales bacterium]|nr:hypothetical protein [Clostridiales bacterium]
MQSIIPHIQKEIKVKINSVEIGNVSEVKIKSTKDCEFNYSYGENLSNCISENAQKHIVEFSQMIIDENYHHLSSEKDFTLAIEFPFETVVFSGCQWSECSTVINAKNTLVEKAVIVCNRKEFSYE